MTITIYIKINFNTEKFIYLWEFNLIFIILIFSLKALSHKRIDFVLLFYTLEEEALALIIAFVNNIYKYFKNEYINRLVLCKNCTPTRGVWKLQYRGYKFHTPGGIKMGIKIAKKEFNKRLINKFNY